MTEIKKENKDHVIQEGLACNCIIMAGVFKLVNLVKRLFNKSDNKNVGCDPCDKNCPSDDDKI
ncbi:MAG: hypothetical protein GX935_00355 [Erysipelotrichia bacterium]|nr:hypothetical protein [Erysipelotrichia bacterium]